MKIEYNKLMWHDRLDLESMACEHIHLSEGHRPILIV